MASPHHHESSSQLRTTQDIAEKLQVRPQTLKNWRVQGKGPTYVKVGKFVRYRDDDVMAWLDRRVSYQE